jgi:hypothetical protein
VLGRTAEISTKEGMFHAQMEARGRAYPATPLPCVSDELLAALKEKFPDCSVSFQEDWVETRQGVKELKKGILIDWS